MPKSSPVGGTFSGSGREGAMLTMQASDLWKERVGKELEVIHHGPFEKKRLPWEHTSDRDQHNWLAANSAAELWTLRRNEAAAEAAAAGTTRNHPPPTPQQHGIPMPRSTGLSSQQARARPMEVMMTSGGRPDRSELVNPTKNGLYGPGGTAELLNPPVPPKRLYPPSRLDDAAYPTEAKELAERAAAFRFSQPRGPGGFCFFDAGGPVVGLTTEPHVDDALRARRSDMLRRERGR